MSVCKQSFVGSARSVWSRQRRDAAEGCGLEDGMRERRRAREGWMTER